MQSSKFYILIIYFKPAKALSDLCRLDVKARGDDLAASEI
jgi:phage terminase large subunit-like protein